MAFFWMTKNRINRRGGGWLSEWSTPLLGGIITILVLCNAPVAYAQINPFRTYGGPTLSKSDIDAGAQAAGRLLGDAPKPVGSVEDWSSPESGNAGTLTVERVYHRQGHNCRAVRSRVTYKAGSQRSFLFNACRVSGQWKLWD